MHTRPPPGLYRRSVSALAVVALAVGAPKDSGALDLRRDCPDCGAETGRFD